MDNPQTLATGPTERPSNSPQTGDAFAGGGALGALIRSLDWNRTLLGSTDSWPQSLLTSVSIVLASRFPLSIWWGPEYVLLYNDAYAPLLGAKHPAALGQPALEVWSEIKEIIGPMLERVSTTGEATYNVDGLLPISRHGFLEECYFTWSWSPIRIESGGVGGVFTVVTETTEQVLGERRRRLLRVLATATSGATHVDQACLAAVRSFQPDVVPFSLIYLLDSVGQTARLVATSELAAGQPASPAVIDCSAPTAVWPLASARAPGSLQRVDGLAARFGVLPTGGWPEPLREGIVLPISRPNEQSPFGFLVAGLHPGQPLNDSYRSFFDLVGSQLALALSHARAFEESEARARALAELDRAKITFFSNISHEFRTPLTLLLGPVEDGLHDLVHPPGPVERERLEIVRRNGLRLLRLVNTLLDFSRLEAGRAAASYEPIDLVEFTSELVSNFRSAIERAGLKLVLDFPTHPVVVYIDRDMWEKIVFNLLSNALKFTFDGEIRLTLKHLGVRVALEVRDTGSGIAAEELPKIFTRFHRVQGVRARTTEGSGIGLAFVHELARLHGGTVHVASTPGAGAAFTVSLPTGSGHLPPDRVVARFQSVPTAIGARPFVEEALQWLPDPAREAPALVGIPNPALIAPPPRDRVLVADDNADMRAYLSRILGERWAVEVVSNGAEALLAARRDPPALLLADVMMPGLDGFDLLRELRADSSIRDVPVVLLSARAGQEARIQGLQSGAEDYLVKPFNAAELIARVALHVEQGRSRARERAARDQLHRRFMQLPAGVLSLRGKEHIIELANPAYQKLVGDRAVRGLPLCEAMPELIGQPFLPQLDSVLRTGVPVVGEEALAMIDQLGTGVPQECFFNYTYQPTFSAPDEVDGVLVFVFEVTRQVRARQHVESLVTQAAHDDRRKDEFLAMLAHELRNPLAALSTALYLLGRREVRDEQERHSREICNRQVATLVRLVDDLLDVSRITRGRVELRRERTDLVTVVNAALQTTRPHFERRQHQVAIQVGAGSFTLHADPTRLEQVFTNLLTNAAKYTDQPGRIEVRLNREQGPEILWACVEISDPGRGLAPEMLERIFDLFAQVDSGLVRSESGLGIGLTLVRSLVELHGGRIHARSDGLGHGTTVTVCLPLSAAPIPESMATIVDPPASLPSFPAQRRIVLVEDNEDASEMLRDLLIMLGHEVSMASDGIRGRDLILATRPDLALVDIGLPGLDGYQVARAVRRHPALVATRLVALTGYGDAGSSARAHDAGFDAHLTKPISIEQLEQQLVAIPTARLT